jgi:hypothetical protein
MTGYYVQMMNGDAGAEGHEVSTDTSAWQETAPDSADDTFPFPD